MSAPTTRAVILAAGEGRRMRSAIPKVLHAVDGISMLQRSVDAATEAGVDQVVVIVGHGREDVADHLDGSGVELVVQEEQLGTGHAVLQAKPWIEGFDGNVVVLYGDMPMLSPETIRSVVDHRNESRAAVVALTMELDNPPEFGRIVRDGAGKPVAIVETKDATAEQMLIKEVNVGVYCFDAAALCRALDQLAPTNAQGEYYLTDAISVLAAGGDAVDTVSTDRLEDALGVNDPEHLDFAEKLRHIRYAEERYSRVDVLASERKPPGG